MSHNYQGVLSGFVPTYVIYSGKVDATVGLVGYLPSDKSIYITYQGSTNIPNWFTNLSTAKTSWTTFPECNCKVHLGFFSATQAVWPDVLAAVKKLKTLYPTYAVKVTGHSLGAAQALLTQMDLI
jgi:hypothetical protein